MFVANLFKKYMKMFQEFFFVYLSNKFGQFYTKVEQSFENFGQFSGEIGYLLKNSGNLERKFPRKVFRLEVIGSLPLMYFSCLRSLCSV